MRHAYKNRGKTMASEGLSIADLNRARELFLENEPRDLFYRVATELVERSISGESSLSLAESLAVLLQTWNSAYYRFNRFSSDHFHELDALLNDRVGEIRAYRHRTIASITSDDEEGVGSLFHAFEMTLGPVGASKTLHLLAPQFFPLWDRSIAEAYGLPLRSRGSNSPNYWAFMHVTKVLIEHVGGAESIGRNPLKAIDEYHYCKHTKHWL